MRQVYRVVGREEGRERTAYVRAASPMTAQAHAERRGMRGVRVESVDEGELPEGATIEDAGRETVSPPRFSLDRNPVMTIAVGVALGILLAWAALMIIARLLGGPVAF